MTKRRITVLPDHIANKIAAGEVIQRPESVVKELLENSVDAGAQSLTVVIREGGKKLIQVVDDGSGMDEQDALASFLRHATSKIVAYEDLEAIRTYGFRGEALASIAAVARVTLTTRTIESDVAVVVIIDGGGETRVSREAREPGTTFTVRDLFYNVPARRKFLKSTSTEFRHVYEVALRTALSHPEIALRFISDDETIFDVKPSPLEERVVDLLGSRQREGIIPVTEVTDFLEVRGYIGKPAFSQRSRNNQYLFLNGRFIVNRNINYAVYSSYEHLMIKGTFPFFLLFLTVDPAKVDINVHPSKMEAKFDDEQSVYRVVSALVRKALASSDFAPAVALSRKEGEFGLRFSGSQHAWPGAASHAGTWSFPERDRVDPRTGEILTPSPAAGRDTAGQLFGSIPGGSDAFLSMQTAPHEGVRPEPGTTSLIWQLHNKYILSQIRNGLMIVDQHVAHERVLYERALERFEGNMHTAQQLLFPYTVQLSPPDYLLMTELLPHFAQLGFDIKLFGKNTIVIEGVPPDVRVGNEERIVGEMLILYREYQEGTPLNVRDNLAKSFSCKSAVKAGDVLTEQEMRSLIDQLFATKMPYVCPHGRPVVLRISIEELDRRFGRN